MLSQYLDTAVAKFFFPIPQVTALKKKYRNIFSAISPLSGKD